MRRRFFAINSQAGIIRSPGAKVALKSGFLSAYVESQGRAKRLSQQKYINLIFQMSSLHPRLICGIRRIWIVIFYHFSIAQINTSIFR